jgi:hypothetical protein
MTQVKEKTRAQYVVTLFVWAILLSLFAAGGKQMWDTIDQSGWINHMEDTSITVQGNWLEGESKDCSSPVLSSAEAVSVGKVPGYALGSIVCDSGPSHAVRIQFYGQQYQSGKQVAMWRCTRTSVSAFSSWAFTCKQTGGM